MAAETNIIRIGTSQTDTYLTGVVHGNGSALTGVPAVIANGSITSAKLASNRALAGTTTGTFSGPLTGSVTGNVSGSAAGFTGAMAGDVTGTQGATAIAATTVTGKALTGFVSGAGTVTASDSILTAINKLDGNVAATAPLSSRNPMQIALRRWYDANQSGNTTFAVGLQPRATAFDGANIWVANNGNNTVTKLRASDGACVGTCAFAVGISPVAVAFDGANIWVTNQGSNNVTRLRASDGSCVGTCTFAVGTNPFGAAFDGVNVWVANNASNTVTKL